MNHLLWDLPYITQLYMLCCESGLLEVSLLWLREILHSQSPDMGAVAIFFLPQMLIDIRSPNHAMIKKKKKLSYGCSVLGKQQLNPRIHRG